MADSRLTIGSFFAALIVLAAGLAGTFFLIFAQSKWLPIGQHNSSSSSSTSSFPFPDFQPIVKSGSVVLFQSLVIQETITPDVIKKNSLRIKINGMIGTGSLVVKASATTRGYDPNRRHSVYFYINDGLTGGHIDATREEGRIVTGGFTIAGGGLYDKVFFNKVPVSDDMGGKKDLMFIDILNDEQPHWIGAFVSTGVFGSLDELRIDYLCSKETPDCSIEVL